jgi:2-keto-3-deoxy-galactonokinase
MEYEILAFREMVTSGKTSHPELRPGQCLDMRRERKEMRKEASRLVGVLDRLDHSIFAEMNGSHNGDVAIRWGAAIDGYLAAEGRLRKRWIAARF